MSKPIPHYRHAAPVLGLALGLVACGGGGSSKSATPAPPSTPKTMTLSVGAGITPAWVACQDGDGAWKKVEPADGKYSFSVADARGRYGLALATSDASPRYNVELWQATVGELPNITYGTDEAFSIGSAGPYTLSGSATGYGSGETARAYFGDRNTTLSPTRPAFTFYQPAGTYDLCVVGQGRSYLQRNVDLQADTALPPIDLNAQALPFTQQSATLQGVEAEETGGWMAFLQTTRTSFVSLGAGANQGPAVQLPVLSPAQRLGSDLYLCLAATEGRYVYQYFDLASAPVVNLPSHLAAPTVGFAGGTPELRCQWAASPNTTFYEIHYQQDHSAGQAPLMWHGVLTPGWLGAAPSHTQPDLSGIAGFAPTWRFSPSQPLTWYLYAVTATNGIASPYPWSKPGAGRLYGTAYQGGSITPPGMAAPASLSQIAGLRDPRHLLALTTASH